MERRFRVVPSRHGFGREKNDLADHYLLNRRTQYVFPLGSLSKVCRSSWKVRMVVIGPLSKAKRFGKLKAIGEGDLTSAFAYCDLAAESCLQVQYK